MPSGNAIFTYTGPNDAEDVQGQIFLKDQPKHITDQGVIAVCAARKDFAESLTEGSLSRAIAAAADAEARGVKIRKPLYANEIPAKPKKAKGK